ncbi:protein containg NurA domain [Longilinea arvoryzae]|uniref:Protein containg NurA domain n=1 Tax=Longilinea arvoryzae TaxID=360412 RepID=A0A0S7BEW4_9CHLR|nr:DNA double-strand break repair nuclease NurA [Longilinea arvoryzae]GAP12982.1 protein containg NurA domain [Longilinea arvoryzae]
MPVNYQDIKRQIQENASQAGLKQRELTDRLEKARALLRQYAGELDFLQQRVEIAARQFGLRCARPLTEPLDFHAGPPTGHARPVVLAADGSQVTPSRHDEVIFGLINVGLFRMGGGGAPSESVEGHLFSDDELYPAQGGMIDEDLVALKRDLRERNFLLEKARQEDDLVLALVDGPLLYRKPRDLAGANADKAVKDAFADFLAVSDEMARREIAMAGYVDKPGADLLVRLLELADAPADDLANARDHRPFRRVSDVALLGSLLEPGQRSAVFALESTDAREFSEPARPHFFYINVGAARPYLARVEIPAWAAEDAAVTGAIHAVLLEQCRMMGPRAYPYALHRAHEIAVVTFEEKRQIGDMIAFELRKQGIEPEGGSHKQNAKNAISGGKGRYNG